MKGNGHVQSTLRIYIKSGLIATRKKNGQQCSPSLQDSTRRLREEQDAAYQQSLRDDQERERQRSAQRTQQEAAERAAAEAAAQARCACIPSYCYRLMHLLPICCSAHFYSTKAWQDLPEPDSVRVCIRIRRMLHIYIMTVLSLWHPHRAAQDAEARRIADRAALLAARRVSNRAALRPEPVAGSTGTTALRIRLPDGSTHMRKFASAASLQVCHTVFYFCLCMPDVRLPQQPNSHPVNYGLLSRNSPGTTFSTNDSVKQWVRRCHLMRWLGAAGALLP